MQSAFGLLLAAAAVLSLPAVESQAPARQDQHAAMNHRGETVMGFDQEKTAHHFLLFEDGGVIDVAVKSASDTASRDAIRAHLPHLSQLFGQGNFESPMLVHDTKHVPGLVDMARLKAKITYRYAETPSGGRVDIRTSDVVALAAVHEFLRFQITDHKTGDPLTVRER